MANSAHLFTKNIYDLYNTVQTDVEMYLPLLTFGNGLVPGSG